MGTRTRAISLLALGLGLGGLSQDVQAAPSTPPPPTKRATPPPPSSDGGAASPTPFLPTPRTSPSSQNGATTPPPPSTSTPPGPSESTEPARPDEPPQDLSDTWGFSRKSTGITPRYVRGESGTDPTYAAPNPVGFYSGVSVQGNQVPPFPAKQKGTTPALMTWTGFERSPEGSRVFFQLSAEADYNVDRKEQTLHIRMRNTKVNVRNNLRHLDLRYFDTPVRTVKVRRKGRDTVATIVLKQAVEPTVQFVEGKGGYKLLVVQFSDAGGTAAEPPPPPPGS